MTNVRRVPVASAQVAAGRRGSPARWVTPALGRRAAAVPETPAAPVPRPKDGAPGAADSDLPLRATGGAGGRTPSAAAVARVQRLIGNQATGRYLHRLGLGPVTEAGTGPAVQRDHHQGLVTGGGLKVDGGQAATSWSLGGGAKKPLGIVQAKLALAGVDRDVDLHVHLNAEDPVDNFTGANVRYRGTGTGFAYWPGGAVSATPWLKTALDAGVPDWSKKATWTAVDTDHKIAWQGLRNAGWRFDEAHRAATRRAKQHYWMRFEIGAKGKTQTQAKQAVEDQVPAGTAISAKKVNGNKQWEVTLTFATEQDAYEHAAEVEASVRGRWAGATFTYEARSADWK